MKIKNNLTTPIIISVIRDTTLAAGAEADIPIDTTKDRVEIKA